MDWKTTYHAPVRLVQVIVEPSAADSPVIRRGLRIFKDRMTRRCGAATTLRSAEFILTVGIDPTIGTDGFSIHGTKHGVKIMGSCPRAVVYGLGKYLHTSAYSADGFHPSRWQGTSNPTSQFRGMQLDTHWCNFYHMAPAHELAEYVEDIILWGVNYVEFVFPLIDLLGWDDPEVDKITGQIKTIYDTAKALGVKVGMEVVPNQDFVNQNMDICAQMSADRPGGKTGHNICPNKPGAIEYICNHTQGRTFEHLKAHGVVLDFVCFWPYDEGGCGCEACKPWGANGYLKASRAVADVVRTYLPEAEVILSTWMFDTYKEEKWSIRGQAEWEGLSRALAQDNDWVNYILADAREDFPAYPLKHGVPGNLPLLNYPEISMYKLKPWGGFGANPLPDHFEKLWQQVKDVVQGGMAYSEGIFNDINKALVSQFYWDKNTTAEQTLREYMGYEFAPFVYDEVRQAMRLMEQNHEIAASGPSGVVAVAGADPDKAHKVCRLLNAVDETLDARARKSWRWRLLIIRAELDVLRYRCAEQRKEELAENKLLCGEVLRGCDAAKPWLTELAQILHSNFDFNQETHPHYASVRPPLMEIENR